MASTLARQHIAHILTAFSTSPWQLRSLLSLRSTHTVRVGPTLSLQDLASLTDNDVIYSHLAALKLLYQQKIVEAFEAQLKCTAAVRQLLADREDNSLLPALEALALDLRLLAAQADAVQEQFAGGTSSGAQLQAAMAELTNCFRAVSNDRNPDLSQSKKLGMLALVNHLYCIAFRLNNFAFLKPLMRVIEKEQAIVQQSPLAHRVTFEYYMGRKAMYDADYRSADEHLSFALTNCHQSSLRNKRLILIHLIPINMLIGRLPKPELLAKYNLEQFQAVAEAVRSGNLRQFQRELDAQGPFFMQWGIYLLLEKLKLLAYRNLFKRVYIINGGNHHIRLQLLQEALEFADDEDVDMDEVECILANLIHQRYIKGYIAHQQKILVCSKDQAFPPIRKA